MAPDCRTVGAVRRAQIAWAQCGGPSVGENGFLGQVAHLLGDDILLGILLGHDILRAIEIMNTWFVVMIILFGVGALTLQGYDMRHVLIWTFGWFVSGRLLSGYRGEHL